MSLDTKTPQLSVSERRGQRLAHLQTNFSRPTSQLPTVASSRPLRVRPSDYEDVQEERVPLQPANVKRQSSKSSLRYIFSREKALRKPTDSKLSGIDEVQNLMKDAQAPSETTAPLSPTACATPQTATTVPTLVTSSPIDSDRSRTPSNRRPKPHDRQQLASDVGWKPPPLFQAYPQAIKHTTLEAPALSADSIVRLHATFKAKGSSLEDLDLHLTHSANGEPSEDLTARRRKLEKERKKYLRTLSENIDKNEWSQKVYLLATSGYILQYSGRGKHDRLPEKMLLLGPKSVAFASDAIPGKHWVLQVSQTAEEDGTNPIETSRPIFSRLGFHRSHARRLARNFLLVFDDPDEMSAWLLAVRAQIETRGGNKYVSEGVFDEEMESQLRSTPSMRQLIKKDPNRFSTMLLQPQQSDKESSVGDQSRRNSYVSLHRRSMVIQPTPESRAGSVSTTQTESIPTTENPGRFYATLASPPLSDGKSHILEPEKETVNVSSTNDKFRDCSNTPSPVDRTGRLHPKHLPPAPNFSVPSFSKRFAARQDIPQVPHLPSSAHGDHPDDTSMDTLSIFSSPPQSPSRQMPSISQRDPRDHRRPSNRRDLLKQQLRGSNSEDSLGHVGQDQECMHLRYSHFPGDSMPALATASGLLPTSTLASVQPSEHSLISQFPKPASEVNNTSDQHNQQIRSLLYYKPESTSRPSSIIISRRKSMSGLSIGPPVAPPPNCPLPKIPSTFIKASAQSGWSKQSAPTSSIEGSHESLPTSSPDSPPGHIPKTTRSVSSHQMIHGI
ncbi:hypothetical protein AOCH_004454 [Aspergillus ochraceoroseus]|uniref:PH domain-containing protein n=1 Tax=Aspergillus ochraceoroseus TaxID=138278 RepID=A0A0F8WG12_9EURO|nr:hypothetical protein AOCH_004454 [Aspergillus ochraceoroseus]